MTRWPVLAAIGLASLALGAGVAVLGPFSGGSVADEPTVLPTANDSVPHDDETDTGNMTVATREATHEGIEPSAPPFYASRLVVVEGDVSLDELEVRLDNPNGPVEVEASDDGGYALVANLTGYGPTPDQAREQRDGLEFHWDAGPPATAGSSARSATRTPPGPPPGTAARRPT